MDTPTTLTDALQALTAAQADLSALNALTNEHTALVAAHTELKARAGQLADALSAAEARALDLAALLDAAKAAEADAAAKANQIVANLGVAPVAIQPEQAIVNKSVSELWAEYNSLPIEARNQFYATHKALLKIR